MLAKIYFGFWMLVAAATALLFLSGNLTNLTLVVVGFACMPLIFTGMIILVPLSIANSRSKSAETARKPSHGRGLLNKLARGWNVDDISTRRLGHGIR